MTSFFYELFKPIKGVVTGKSEKGLKNKQEDAYYISPLVQDRRLVIVADGVGGHGNGDFASNLCVKIFNDELWHTDRKTNPAEFLEQTSILTAEQILQKSKDDETYKNCGTTVSGFLILKDKYYTLNIGDSRVYLFRNGKLKQITEDHSVVNRMIKEGMITEEEAKVHPKRHIMFSALGQPLEQMTISVEGPYQWHRGDLFIACTDGVHEVLNEERLVEVISATSPVILADRIVDAAFDAGSTDNITCCCLKL
jgi:PPM family protein phosphatase